MAEDARDKLIENLHELLVTVVETSDRALEKAELQRKVDVQTVAKAFLAEKLAERQEFIAHQQTVRDAAAGDLDALQRLPNALQAFIVSYLDDDQRKELAGKSVADVTGALPRFRELGAEELDEYERRTGRKFVAPKPRHRDHDRYNENRLDM